MKLSYHTPTKKPSRFPFPGGCALSYSDLYDFIIFAVIGLASGAGKAHICAGDGAARSPNGLTTNRALGATLLGVQRSFEGFY